MTGGAGADVFWFEAGEGNVITDFNLNEDKLIIPNKNVVIEQVGSDTRVSLISTI